MARSWLSQRVNAFETSGIRRVFELARSLKNPVNLSIGQPDFDVPEPVRRAAVESIESGQNSYTVTQGIPELRDRLRETLAPEVPGEDRELLVTSGTSGGLVLALMATIDPGDEVLFFDPYFVMYPALFAMAGGTSVKVETYPEFRLDLDKVRAALTPRTKVILLNSPSNPTGILATQEEVQGLAELAQERDLLLISDEIYRPFTYDEEFISPLAYNPRTLVIDGFSKSHAMTGWRLGFAHGPREVIESMQKLQQYTFVCAPQPAQWAGLAALDVDPAPYVAEYRRKRDLIISGLQEDYELAVPGGAFYLFPRVPWGTGESFVKAAIEKELLVIPGQVFSDRDTHFRISYAACDETLKRGIDILRALARQGAA